MRNYKLLTRYTTQEAQFAHDLAFLCPAAWKFVSGAEFEKKLYMLLEKQEKQDKENR